MKGKNRTRHFANKPYRQHYTLNAKELKDIIDRIASGEPRLTVATEYGLEQETLKQKILRYEAIQAAAELQTTLF